MTYRVLFPSESLRRLEAYLAALRAGAEAGQRLRRQLAGRELTQLTAAQFLELLVRTKEPRIFAETEVSGDGTDWTPTELRLLGDLSVAVPVTIYDDGRHAQPTVHDEPFGGHLLFTPGALLRARPGTVPADWDEVTGADGADRGATPMAQLDTAGGRRGGAVAQGTRDVTLDPERYYRLYERRLMPPLRFANDHAAERGARAFVTVPGLGCGQFAGPFRGRLGEALKDVLLRLLETHAAILPAIAALYYDPYSEGRKERHRFGHLDFLVRPLLRGNERKPQLCRPAHYAEAGDDFADCLLFSVVAWDHVSWPGNDFYGGARATDDGVKAAATDAIGVLTGIPGTYRASTHQYDPPPPFATWEQLIRAHGLELAVADRLTVSGA